MHEHVGSWDLKHVTLQFRAVGTDWRLAAKPQVGVDDVHFATKRNDCWLSKWARFTFTVTIYSAWSLVGKVVVQLTIFINLGRNDFTRLCIKNIDVEPFQITFWEPKDFFALTCKQDGPCKGIYRARFYWDRLFNCSLVVSLNLIWLLWVSKLDEDVPWFWISVLLHIFFETFSNHFKTC